MHTAHVHHRASHRDKRVLAAHGKPAELTYYYSSHAALLSLGPVVLFFLPFTRVRAWRCRQAIHMRATHTVASAFVTSGTYSLGMPTARSFSSSVRNSFSLILFSSSSTYSSMALTSGM